MFANDKFGDCVWAGAAHETMMWTREGPIDDAMFTDANVLSDYSAVTGFNPSDPNSDVGTDMQMAASYRRNTGIIDAAGNRHKIDAYVALNVGVVSDAVLAAYLFGAAGVGILFPDTAFDQFHAGQPWDVVPGAPKPVAGHYVSMVGRNSAGNLLVVTWGRLHAMTPRFYLTYNDESLAYVSLEPLTRNLLSPEGFDVDTLRTDLKAVQTTGAKETP